MSRRRFTPEELALIVALRKEGASFGSIGKVLGASDQACWYSYHRHSNGAPPVRESRSLYISYEEERAALASVPRTDTRSLTQRICGDPIVERSALFRKRMGEPA